MSEFVRDSAGQTYELRPPRPDDYSNTMHLSFREAVDRLRSVTSILGLRENHVAMARALADIGMLDVSTADNQPFDQIQDLMQRAVDEGRLRITSHTRNLRPICESFETADAAPLVDEEGGEPEPMQASESAAPAEEPPWPGDAAAQAQTLHAASEAGTPFCEVCERNEMAKSA